MLLLCISAHLYVVFLENERALEYLYLGSVACVRLEDEALLVCLCLPLYLIV